MKNILLRIILTFGLFNNLEGCCRRRIKHGCSRVKNLILVRAEDQDCNPEELPRYVERRLNVFNSHKTNDPAFCFSVGVAAGVTGILLLQNILSDIKE